MLSALTMVMTAAAVAMKAGVSLLAGEEAVWVL